VDSHFGTPFFAGHIYAVVSPRDNEWGTDYWLARCLEGKKTLMRSVTDSEGIEFPIGSMVIKGEYLTQDERTQRKVVMYFNIINQVKLYTTLQTWLLVQTSNYKQCQVRTHQRYDTSFLTLSTRS
jgi:hypothetical protein